jgi:hypothetical protein
MVNGAHGLPGDTLFRGRFVLVLSGDMRLSAYDSDVLLPTAACVVQI